MANEPSTGTVYTYARISNDDRRTGSCSLAWQKDVIRQWLSYHDEIADGEYVDNGVSGSIPLDQRPQGKQLVSQATQAGDKIIVAKRDRIFRDVDDFRARLKVWREQRVDLIVLDDGLDTSTLMGRFCATIIVAAAELERGLAVERIHAAIATRKEHRLKASSEAPFGYRHVPFGEVRKNGSQECRVEVHPDEQIIVDQICMMRDACLSLRKIAEALNATKAPTRHGKPWQHSMVQKILDNIDAHQECGYQPNKTDISYAQLERWIADEKRNQA